VQKVNYEEKQVVTDYVLSYDDMLRLLDEIESGELENKCTPQQVEKITNFVAFLAKEGVLPDHSPESLSLDDDIEDLLNGADNFYADAISFVTPGEYQYRIIPAILYGNGDVVLCKSWLKKQWKHVRKFAKKHKKALIIGAAVVVATAVVVVAVVAASSAAAASAASAAGAAGAGAASSNKPNKKEEKEDSSSTSIPSGTTTTQEAPLLKAAIDNQVSSFKENVIQNQFFQPTNPAIQNQGLSWEENARALGSLFAHHGLNDLQHQLPYHLGLSREVQDIHSKYTFPIPGGYQDASVGHPEIDRKFSTDYTSLYSNPGQEVDFNTLSYQVRGERALAFGYYNQAVQDLGKAIEANPTHLLPYLKRGVAHFGLGEYDRSLEDYKQFTSQAPTSLSVSEFSLGFAKGLPKGIYESGEGMLLFFAEFATHPIHTSEQMVSSITKLVDLVRNDKWGLVAEALSPEMHQLVTQWENLTSEKRGELAGYVLAKNGTDILLPGGLVKVACRSVKGAQELAAFCKNIKIAQETLVLEAAAEIGNGAKIAEVLEAGQRTARLADELGFTAREMGELKQAGKLEETLSNTFENISRNPVARESFELFDRAQEFLKPFKEFMSESQCRELIHKTGIPTFPRPANIPENFRVRISNKGAGMIYLHPEHTHTSIRVMPGKPHSPFPYQQKPYVIYKKNGETLDKFGNVVDSAASEAHIPIEKFLFKG
jgi:tetratricopeptide (TPR) repeat protein